MDGNRCIAVGNMDHKLLMDAQAVVDHASGRTTAKTTLKLVKETGRTLFAEAHDCEHPEAEWFRQLVEPKTAHEVGESHRAWLAHKNKGRGRPPEVPWMEYVFTGARVSDWTKEEADEWCDKAFAEFRRIFPSPKVLVATQHYAEASHHMHIVVEPWGRDAKGNLRKGKSAMIAEGMGNLTNEPPPRRLGMKARQLMGRYWQENCEHLLGLPYGFAAREPGRKKGKRKAELDEVARHEAHAEERERIAKRRVAEMERQLEAAEAERDAIIAERDEAEASLKVAVQADIDELAHQSMPKKLMAAARARELERRNRALERELDDERQQNDALTAKVADVVAERDGLTKRLATAIKQVKHLRGRVVSIRDELEAERAKHRPLPMTQAQRLAKIDRMDLGTSAKHMNELEEVVKAAKRERERAERSKPKPPPKRKPPTVNDPSLKPGIRGRGRG